MHLFFRAICFFAFACNCFSVSAVDPAQAEPSPPPSFAVVAELMLAERSKLESYYVDFTAMTHNIDAENAALLSYFHVGLVAVDGAKGVSVTRQVQVDSSHVLPLATDEEVDLLTQTNKSVVIVDTPDLQVVAGPHGDVVFRKQTRQVNAKPFLPFDLRVGAFGILGDFLKGTKLEELLSLHVQHYGNAKGKWVAPGVAEYLLSSFKVQIDIERGCWPIAYEMFTYEVVDGKAVRKHVSSGNLSLKKRDGVYLPESLVFKSDAHELEYLFDFVHVGKGYPMEDWSIDSIVREFGDNRKTRELSTWLDVVSPFRP